MSEQHGKALTFKRPVSITLRDILKEATENGDLENLPYLLTKDEVTARAETSAEEIVLGVRDEGHAFASIFYFTRTRGNGDSYRLVAQTTPLTPTTTTNVLNEYVPTNIHSLQIEE